jgi:SagB-type dehydrogenase family enzyme
MAISVSARLAAGVRLTVEGGVATVARQGRVVHLQVTSPLVAACLAQLEESGITEDELVYVPGARWSTSDISSWARTFGSLKSSGWLDRTLTSKGRKLLSVISDSSESRFRYRQVPLILDSTKVLLSRFALIRRDDDNIVVESSHSSKRVILHELGLLRLFGSLLAPVDLVTLRSLADDSLTSDEIVAAVRAMTVADVLMTVQEQSATEADFPEWSFTDLLFHARSRLGRSHGGYGGTYRLRDQTEPLAAIKPTTGPVISLPKLNVSDIGAGDPSLSDVCESRVSIREHNDASPITVDQLAALMFRTQRLRWVRTVPGHGEVASRPYPSGGALYELEIYPVVHTCTGLDKGLYRYDGADHCLEVVRKSGSGPERLLELAQVTSTMVTVPQVLLIITARFRRMMWKYESMAYAAILKDVGSLLQTLYLNATAMGLAPCALGGGDSELFAQVTGMPYEEETSVGEFIVGSRPPGWHPPSYEVVPPKHIGDPDLGQISAYLRWCG